MTQQQWGRPQGDPWGGWGQPRQQVRGRQPAQPWPAPTGWQAPQPPPVWPSPWQAPPPPGRRPPRRRRNPLATLLKALVLLAVLGFLGLVALGWALSRVVQSIPVPQPTEVATLPAPEDDQAPAPAPTRVATPAASAPPGTYQNDDYVVPPPERRPPGLPQPESYREATSLLRSNPLYQTSVPRPVRCEMQSIDLARASRRELTGHLNDMVGCLMRVWEGPLTQAGFTPVRPSVTVYSGSVTTKCGKLPAANAVYCAADQQVYYAEDLPRVVPPQLRSSRFVTEAVVAHEFGHAVQARSAILTSELAWEDRSDKSTGLQYSRRLEVQADCFAGQFLGSVQQSTRMTDQELENIGLLFHSIGDDVLTGRRGYEGNHGSGANRRAWTTAGLESTQVGTCNSFDAPANAVR